MVACLRSPPWQPRRHPSAHGSNPRAGSNAPWTARPSVVDRSSGPCYPRADHRNGPTSRPLFCAIEPPATLGRSEPSERYCRFMPTRAPRPTNTPGAAVSSSVSRPTGRGLHARLHQGRAPGADPGGAVAPRLLGIPAAAAPLLAQGRAVRDRDRAPQPAHAGPAGRLDDGHRHQLARVHLGAWCTGTSSRAAWATSSTRWSTSCSASPSWGEPRPSGAHRGGRGRHRRPVDGVPRPPRAVDRADARHVVRDLRPAAQSWSRWEGWPGSPSRRASCPLSPAGTSAGPWRTAARSSWPATPGWTCCCCWPAPSPRFRCSSSRAPRAACRCRRWASCSTLALAPVPAGRLRIPRAAGPGAPGGVRVHLDRARDLWRLHRAPHPAARG